MKVKVFGVNTDRAAGWGGWEECRSDPRLKIVGFRSITVKSFPCRALRSLLLGKPISQLVYPRFIPDENISVVDDGTSNGRGDGMDIDDINIILVRRRTQVRAHSEKHVIVFRISRSKRVEFDCNIDVAARMRSTSRMGSEQYSEANRGRLEHRSEFFEGKGAVMIIDRLILFRLMYNRTWPREAEGPRTSDGSATTHGHLSIMDKESAASAHGHWGVCKQIVRRTQQFGSRNDQSGI